MLKHRIFNFATIWLVLTQTLPPINLIFSFGETIKFVTYITITLVLFPSLFTRRSVLALLVYTVMVFFYHLMGNAFFDTINTIVTVIPVMLSGLLIAEYAFKYDRSYIFSSIIVITVLISNVVMCILSIPQIMMYPNIIRSSSIEQFSDTSVFSWIIKYQTVHGLPILFAPLVAFCRKSFRNKKVISLSLLLVIILLFYVVFRSNAATAFLMSTVMLAVGFFFNEERFDKKTVLRLSIIGLLVSLIMQPVVIGSLLESVQSMMDSSGASYSRIDEIKNSILNDNTEGDLGERQDLYASSFKLFIESPIIGTFNPEKISRHTWIIDRLALYGVIFIIPLVLVFKYHFKSIYLKLIHAKVIYTCGILCLIMMLLLKNDFGQGTWLYGFAYLPLLCRCYDCILENKRR